MCVENTNILLSKDFTAADDSFNWLNNTINPVITESDRLVLRPDSQLSTFTRNAGSLHISNNRVRFKLNLEVYRPQDSDQGVVNYVVQILKGTNIIGQNTVYIEGIDATQVVSYSLDRTYSYEELSGDISIRIKTPVGFKNEIRLLKLDVWDFTFCEEKVRTYFVFADLFEQSQTSQSSGIRMLSWKVGGIETLTASFLAYNAAAVGGNPVAGWKYAKADIDGGNRESAATGRNTFNPFADEFGLTFANTAGNFWGGKPTAVTNGQDFGTGIMQLGFEKPTILNGVLDSKSGAFFIDIDYTQDLLIECDVIINNTSTSVYNNPNIYRKFFISWNATTCTKDFYYINVLQQSPKVDQLVNGFLSGLTDITSSDTVLPCGQLLNFNGNAGAFTFELDLGTAIGMFGINYNAQQVPDKFDLTYNGETVTSKYRGSSTYNTQLTNAGIPMSDINTASPSNGAGQLRLFKKTALPTKATVVVTAPLAGTAWNVTSVCPLPYMEVWLYNVGCGGDISGTPTAVVYMAAENPLTYEPANGDKFYTNTGLTNAYNGSDTPYLMKVPLGSSGATHTVPFSFLVDSAGTVSDVTSC